MIYCVDTGALISAWHFWYKPETHPTFWGGIEDLAEQEQLGFPEQVLHELAEQDDDLYEWCRDRRDRLCRTATDATEEYYARLVNDYPSMIGTVGIGQSYADLYVVAVAAVEEAVVVTTEQLDATTNPRKYKIPHVCQDRGVEWTKPYDIVRREGWVFRHV